MSKVFLRPIDWKEMTAKVVEENLTISKPVYDATTKVVEFHMTLNITRKVLIRLGQQFGIMKRPRCTYKTIRRDCAKRNR